MPDQPGHPGGVDRLLGVLEAAYDERIVERALGSGQLSPAHAALARDEAAGAGRPVTEVLVARGWLTAPALGALEEAEARDEFARAPVVAVGSLPAEAAAVAELAERNLGSFVLVAVLGQGRTGEVWKAWDRRLGRWVALKISTVALESTAARERFEREAHAAARLSHPNIMPVFQVGAERGRAFLVMPYVAGQTLDRVSLPVPRALEVMRDVALAVEHAHGQGIVHRDLKPGNILLDSGGSAFVLDLGLAYLREDSLSRLTHPGEVLGTPSYMAPEQARGDREAAAAAIDIYGLGATLYSLVTGRAPFVGDSFAAVVARVINTEPEPPRRIRPDLDPRVEAVVCKAMDKAPALRYPTAAALAEDLQRILDDRAVDVRRAGLWRRLRVARRPRVWAALAAAVALAAVVGVGRIRARRDSVEVLGELARLSLETALRLRRAGDTAGMRQVLPKLVEAYRRVEERASSSAEIEYLMGRMYRALFQRDSALAHQERALARDPSFAPALYERAILMSDRYGSRLADLLTQPERPGEAPTPEAAERAYPELGHLRARILDDCTRLTSLPIEQARADAARGILAYYRSRFDEARERLERAVAAEPLLEEAWEALALALVAVGNRERAEQTYHRGLELDRGYARHLVGLCGLLVDRDRKQAAADAASALQLDPDSIEARACRAKVSIREGDQRLLRGADPSFQLAAAERDATDILRFKEVASAYFLRASARRYRGSYLARIDLDPLPALAAAEADASRAIALDPHFGRHWAERGWVRLRRARHLHDHGQDARRELEGALADTERAVELAPKSYEFVSRMGEIESLQGLGALERGEPADPIFAAAEDTFGRAWSIAKDVWTLLSRGRMRMWRGQGRVRTGGDPLLDWKDAEADLDESVRTFNGHTDPLATRGQLHAERAEYLMRRNPRLARAELARATADIDRALAQEPRYLEALQVRTRLARLERRR